MSRSHLFSFGYLDGHCPQGWEAWTDNNGCYYFTNDKNHHSLTWDEAYTFCTQDMAQPGSTSTMMTTLLAINSQIESVSIIMFAHPQLS